MSLNNLLIVLMGYIIGSVPSGYLAGKFLKKIDIRDFGSGNIGTTNIFRVLGIKAAIIVFLVDFFKSFLYIMIVRRYFFGNDHLLLVISGLFIILGNVFPIFLNFKGGKGVASSAGLFAGLSPIAFICAFVIFFLSVAKTRYVSLGSLLASLTLFLANLIIYIKYDKSILPIVVLVGTITLFIYLKHIDNIKRLVKGCERKLEFGKSSKKPKAEDENL